MPSDASSPRSRRERPAKPALSRDAIVAAALRVLRTDGLEALSMRRLAQELDTGPASLYVYVANRRELHELVFDAAAATLEVEPVDAPRWREQLKALGRRMVHLMSVEFPGLAELSMGHIPTGDNVLRVMDAMLGMLRAGGMADQAAAYAGDLMSMYITAIAYEQTLAAKLDESPQADEYLAGVAARFQSVSPERYPNLAAVAPLLTRGDGDERFELGLDVIINGLLATPTEGRLSEQSWGT
jgi:AcrR family transcriptional regulator